MSIENEIKKVTLALGELTSAVLALGNVSIVEMEPTVEHVSSSADAYSQPKAKTAAKKKPKTEKPDIEKPAAANDNSPFASNIKDALLNVQNFLGLSLIHI